MERNKISNLAFRFYEIAERGHPDCRPGLLIVDTIDTPCSPDHYDEMLEKQVRQVANRFQSATFQEWVADIIATIETHKADNSGHDLRGMPKNIHIRD